jgi:effector-binding domain-containing protein
MVKKIAIVILALLVLLVVASFFLPRRVHVERSVTVGAPPSTIFTLVNSFKRFNEWSPWAEKDPKASYTFSGPRAGVGAKMAWVGDPKTVKSGSQEIVESRPHTLVRNRLEFAGEGPSDATMTLQPEGTATKVTWALDTDLGWNPVARYLGLLFDRWVGPDYEKGLANLKALSEKMPKVDLTGLSADVVEVRSVPIAFVTATSGSDDQAIAMATGGSFSQVKMFMSQNGLTQAGPPITISTKWDAGSYTFDAGIPIDRLPGQPVPAESTVKIKGTYAGLAAKAVHRGAYSGMRRTYEQLYAWIAINGYVPAGDPWDEYVTDPGRVSAAELVTNVYVPVK